MNALKDIWRGLVQRRLWPVAALLVAALVAVPVALERDVEPVVAAAPAQPVEEAGLQTLVSAASPVEREERRHVVGAAKDPFKPAAGAKKQTELATTTGSPLAPSAGTSTATSTATSTTTTVSGSSTGATGSTGSTGSIGSTPSAHDRLQESVGTPTPREPKPAAPKPAEPKRYAVYSADVRFGPEAEEGDARTLQRLAQLPNAKAPIALFLGILEDRETAVFLVNPRSKSTGEGTCKPTKDDCRRVLLRKGETERFEVMDADGTVKAYELEVVEIRRTVVEEISATVSAKRAAKVDLAAWLRQAAPLQHDAESGLLARVAPEALEEKLAAIAAAIGF